VRESNPRECPFKKTLMDLSIVRAKRLKGAIGSKPGAAGTPFGNVAHNMHRLIWAPVTRCAGPAAEVRTLWTQQVGATDKPLFSGVALESALRQPGRGDHGDR
jgi:hypothetical protein